MTAFTDDASVRDLGREAPLLFGGWEVGLLVIMALLYAAGLYLNPAFFGSTDALFSVLRDASRYGVLAIGMTFVIVNKELDLSVGSTFGLTATIFGMIFAPTYFDMGIWTAVSWCLVMGLTIGLINGFMVTVLEVPAFIATLTMLFIGRGVILGLTGGKNIAFEIKAGDYPAFFRLGEINAFGFNNQIILFIIIAVIAAVALAYTAIGWTTYSVGGNEQAARYAGINTRFVRMRSYVLSSLCAVIAGLMSVAQNKDADPLAGFGLELIAISSVIVGGAAIFGGRGRILGSCLGAILIGLIDKVLREGIPTTRTIDLGDGDDRAGRGGDAIAARRGSGVPGRDPHHRRPDRAMARPTSRDPPPLGLVARAAVAAGPRSRRRRDLGRPDPRRDRAGAGLGQTRDRRLLLPPRRGGRDPDGRALALRSVGEA